jgi:hypothetical protein
MQGRAGLVGLLNMQGEREDDKSLGQLNLPEVLIVPPRALAAAMEPRR